jgi:hypothetical protein
MYRKLNSLSAFFALTVVALCLVNVSSVVAQTRQDCRSQVIERMSAEATRLGLRVQGDFAFQSDGNVLMAVVQVVTKDDKIKSTPINAGGRTKLAYVESEKPVDLPNGFYFIQSRPELAKRMAAKFAHKSGVLENREVTFVSTDKRTIKDLPGVAMMYRGHYWRRISINGRGFWIDGPE